MADLSEIKGEVRFKVLAYRRAAEAVREMGDAILELDSPLELKKIPGIGEAIAGKILEFKETGSIGKLEELKEEIPEEVVSLLQVPGLGPRRARLVFEELGVRSLEDLQEAAESHRLASLKGLGPKAEANILEGIRHLRTTSDRIYINQAYEQAAGIIASLEEELPGLLVSEAGSLRRMKETIGDIDILAASRDPQKVMRAFRGLPLVEKVLLSGDTKTSVQTRESLQVDLRVVDPGSWGAALQYFTGSKEHNVRLREHARRMGLKVNEYGVFRIEDGSRVAGEDEAGVYAALGMDMPPPELREDRGEIEAALRGVLPRLVSRDAVRGDFHVHTRDSDGFHTLREMRAAAEELGYSWLGICNHAANLRVARGLDREALLALVEEIEGLNAAGDSPVELLAGCELNIGNQGELDYDDEALSRLHFAIASVHAGFGQPRERITRRMVEAMRNPYVNIIGHPTGRLIGSRPPYDVDLDELITAAAETGTALELNAFPDRLDLCDHHLRRAKEAGVKIAIGTDAHRAEHLRFMLYGVATARRGWLEAPDVLNLLRAEELRRIFRPGRIGA
jgi:DNA polymerase (family 10)